MKPMLVSRSRAIYWAVLLFLIAGCASKIVRIHDYGDIQNYDRRFIGDDLAVGVTIQERPDNRNFFVNRPFKCMKLMVVNIKMKNIGQDTMVVNRQDIGLITEDGRKFVPRSKNYAARRVKGPLNIFRLLSIRSISWGYHAFGLDRRIVLYPNEEKSGYLFYKVGKYYDLAKEGDIRILFSRINLIDKTEYKLKMEERKER